MGHAVCKVVTAWERTSQALAVNNNSFHSREEVLVRNGGEFTCGSQGGNLRACIFSLHHVSSGNQTQAVRFSHKLYPLNHPTSPCCLSPVILCSVLFGLWRLTPSHTPHTPDCCSLDHRKWNREMEGWMVEWDLEITDRKQGRCCCLVREPPKSLVSQSAMFYSVIQRATTVMGNSQFLTLRWENSRVGKVPLIPVLYRSLTNSRRK